MLCHVAGGSAGVRLCSSYHVTLYYLILSSSSSLISAAVTNVEEITSPGYWYVCLMFNTRVWIWSRVQAGIMLWHNKTMKQKRQIIKMSWRYFEPNFNGISPLYGPSSLTLATSSWSKYSLMLALTWPRVTTGKTLNSKWESMICGAVTKQVVMLNNVD